MLDERKLRVDGFGNHWLDSLIGCDVAASIQNIELPQIKIRRVARRRITFAEMRRNREPRLGEQAIRENT